MFSKGRLMDFHFILFSESATSGVMIWFWFFCWFYFLFCFLGFFLLFNIWHFGELMFIKTKQKVFQLIGIYNSVLIKNVQIGKQMYFMYLFYLPSTPSEQRLHIKGLPNDIMGQYNFILITSNMTRKDAPVQKY